MVTGERISKFEIRGDPDAPAFALSAGKRSNSDSGGLCSTGPLPTRTITFCTRPRRAVGMILSSSIDLPPAANWAIDSGANWITRYIDWSAGSVPQPILHSGAATGNCCGSMLLDTIRGLGKASFFGAGRSSSGCETASNKIIHNPLMTVTLDHWSGLNQHVCDPSSESP